MHEKRRCYEHGKQNGKAGPTTQAGAFVKEQIEPLGRGKHPVESRTQVIAIGLLK